MNPLAYRTALREELRLAGPLAMEMLWGRASIDPIVVLTAAKAAGLLPLEPGDLRAGVAAAAGLASLGEALDAVSLDLSLQDEEDLHALLALAGVAAVARGEPHARLEDALARAEADIATSDSQDATVATLALSLRDTLDLDDDHPAARLLELIASPPVPDLHRAPAPIRAAWIAKLQGQVATFLAAQNRPVPAYAADDALPAMADRHVLATGDGEEIGLLVVGEDVWIEWAGDGPAPPHGAELNGVPLAPRPSVSGNAAWSLGAPPTGTPVVRLRFPDRPDWIVELGGW